MKFFKYQQFSIIETKKKKKIKILHFNIIDNVKINCLNNSISSN